MGGVCVHTYVCRCERERARARPLQLLASVSTNFFPTLCCNCPCGWCTSQRKGWHLCVTYYAWLNIVLISSRPCPKWRKILARLLKPEQRKMQAQNGHNVFWFCNFNFLVLLWAYNTMSNFSLVCPLLTFIFTSLLWEPSQLSQWKYKLQMAKPDHGCKALPLSNRHFCLAEKILQNISNRKE